MADQAKCSDCCTRPVVVDGFCEDCWRERGGQLHAVSEQTTHCQCDDTDARRYALPDSPQPSCWHCFAVALGDGDTPEPTTAEDRVRVIAELKQRRASAQPAETARLLAEVRAFITRYVVLPSGEVADLLALWTLHTWALDAAYTTPYLRIVSAAPSSGKTRLLEVLAAVARRGWHTVNPSAAVLYRKVHAVSPSLLLDEIDNLPLKDRLDALAVLNNGYKRGATVDRCKENGDLEAFSCFCPKVFAGLDKGSMPDTLLARSVTIRMDRKARSEPVGRWLARRVAQPCEQLRERCETWAASSVETLADLEPDLPDALSDRGCEVWEPLLAIAEFTGGGWPERARRAARLLTAGGDACDEEPLEVALLSDIREVFGDDHTASTERLLAELNAIEEHQWGARRRGEGLDARGLATMLRPFKIKSRTVRAPGVSSTSRGYRLEQFDDAFSRYLPEATHPTHPTHPSAHGTRDVSDVSDVSDFEGAGNEREQDATPASGEEEALAERLIDEYGDGEQ